MLPNTISELKVKYPDFYQRLKLNCNGDREINDVDYHYSKISEAAQNAFNNYIDEIEKKDSQKSSGTSNYKSKQVKNTSIKTSMGQVSASKGQVWGVQRTGNGHLVGQDYGQVAFETLVNQINSKSPTCYIYEPTSGVKTLQHLITICIAFFGPDYDRTLHEAREVFEKFNFLVLFGGNTTEGWTKKFETMLDKLWFSSRRVENPEINMSIPLWFYANVVRAVIPAGEKRMKTEGQIITDVELGFILKKITEAVLHANHEKGNLYRVLTNKYFMKAKADFKTKTDRCLNNTKLKRMTTILHDAILIIRVHRSNGKKRKPNLYKIGTANPMAIDKWGGLYR